MSDTEEKVVEEKKPKAPPKPPPIVKTEPKEDETTKTFKVHVASDKTKEKNGFERPVAHVETVKAESKREALEKTKGAFAAYEVK